MTTVLPVFSVSRVSRSFLISRRMQAYCSITRSCLSIRLSLSLARSSNLMSSSASLLKASRRRLGGFSFFLSFLSFSFMETPSIQNLFCGGRMTIAPMSAIGGKGQPSHVVACFVFNDEIAERYRGIHQAVHKLKQCLDRGSLFGPEVVCSNE